MTAHANPARNLEGRDGCGEGTFEHGYALLIGVDKSSVPRWSLPGVANDVVALKKVLIDRQRCAYPEDNVRVLTGKDATKENIIGDGLGEGLEEGLAWLGNRIAKNPESTAIVYFSGHGHHALNPETGSEEYFLLPFAVEEVLKDGELVPRTETALPATAFAASIEKLNPQRLLVLLDCCHAAGMGVKAPAAGADGLASTAIPAHVLMAGHGRAVISSSTGEQLSYLQRNGEADKAASIFTCELIDALNGHGTPDSQAETVLVTELMSYVYRHVPKSAWLQYLRQQVPQYRLEGEFPVALHLGGKGLQEGMKAPARVGGVPKRWRNRLIASAAAVLAIVAAVVLLFFRPGGDCPWWSWRGCLPCQEKANPQLSFTHHLQASPLLWVRGDTSVPAGQGKTNYAVKVFVRKKGADAQLESKDLSGHPAEVSPDDGGNWEAFLDVGSLGKWTPTKCANSSPKFVPDSHEVLAFLVPKTAHPKPTVDELCRSATGAGALCQGVCSNQNPCGNGTASLSIRDLGPAVAGRVQSGVPNADLKVLPFIYVPDQAGMNKGWFFKPTANHTGAPIDSRGRWISGILSGRDDETVTRIAAFLVNKNDSFAMQDRWTDRQFLSAGNPFCQKALSVAAEGTFLPK